jgi:putative FmdB family regulatory protein
MRRDPAQLETKLRDNGFQAKLRLSFTLMPTYEYECETCGHHFEVFQSMKDAKLTDCPQEQCAGTVRRLLGTGAGVIFKGSGFYETDYRSESYKAGAKKAEEGAKSSGAGGSSSTEAKPAAPAAAPSAPAPKSDGAKA